MHIQLVVVLTDQVVELNSESSHSINTWTSFVTRIACLQPYSVHS